MYFEMNRDNFRKGWKHAANNKLLIDPSYFILYNLVTGKLPGNGFTFSKKLDKNKYINGWYNFELAADALICEIRQARNYCEVTESPDTLYEWWKEKTTFLSRITMNSGRIPLSKNAYYSSIDILVKNNWRRLFMYLEPFDHYITPRDLADVDYSPLETYKGLIRWK